MQIRLLRLKKGWSQEQLAEMAGVSTRTIQRIERGAKASPETLKCLGAVFETDFNTLQETDQMPAQTTLSTAEQDALEYVRDIKGFYNHLIVFFVVSLFLVAFNLFVTRGSFWAVWPIAGWSVGVILHAINTFEFVTILDANWERRQVEKRLKRH